LKQQVAGLAVLFVLQGPTMAQTKKNAPRFSDHTLKFLMKASRQKNPDWLNRNREEYEEAILAPLKNLASHLKAEIAPSAPNYHFPQKGIGRLRRSARSESKELFKDWLSYTASVPAESRFERNPSLFFMINPHDEEGDEVLVAGGLYKPSSRQVRALREAIAADASAFEKLFRTSAFKARFPKGFSEERSSSRVPRGFPAEHPKMNWIKLQAFFVWRSYKKKEYTSPDFPKEVARDWKQILQLNFLLDQAISGKRPQPKAPAKTSKKLLDRLEEIEAPQRSLDF
jgi:uncharacterized protein (TIGR02453 family)